MKLVLENEEREQVVTLCLRHVGKQIELYAKKNQGKLMYLGIFTTSETDISVSDSDTLRFIPVSLVRAKRALTIPDLPVTLDWKVF